MNFLFFFSGQIFKFDFFLVALANFFLGMDFFTKFGLSITQLCRRFYQVLHAASDRTFSKARTASFITPCSTDTAAAVTAPLLQVQKLLKEFPSLSAATPNRPSHQHLTLEKGGIIRRSITLCIHLVPKKDGFWRPCGDYRHYNAVTNIGKVPSILRVKN